MAKAPQYVTYQALRLVDGTDRQGDWQMVAGGFVNESGYSFIPIAAVIEARSETARTKRPEEIGLPDPVPLPDD